MRTFDISKVKSSSESLWLTPKGGRLEFESKPVILDAPEEAVREDVLVKLRTPDIGGEVGGQEDFVEVFQIEATNKEGRIITRFERPVILMVDLKESGSASEKLVLSRLNEDGRWEHLPTTINADKTIAYTGIDLTGTFALLEMDFSSDLFWLTEEGGRLEFNSKPAILDVPPQAVSESLLVSLSVTRPSLGEEIFDGLTLTDQDSEGKSLKKFNNDVTLMASFSEYKDQIPEDRRAALYRWDGKEWVHIPSQVDREFVYAKVNHLGSFGVGLAPIQPSYGAQHLPTINGFGNDEFSGNSSAHYAFSLPPTPGGIPFNLGLSYSSESANSIFARRAWRQSDPTHELESKFQEELKEYKRQASIVGWGWNLSGLGTITRELSGQNRVFLSYAGGRFELKSSGYREWQTEPQAFLKIQSNSDDPKTATQWWVWAPDGTRYTFGSPNWGQGVAYNRHLTGCQQVMTEVHLTEIRDVHRNTIEINYHTEIDDWKSPCSNPVFRPYVRAIYPTEIKYFAVGEGLDTARIGFHYAQRSDMNVDSHDVDEVQALFSESRLMTVTAEVRRNSSSYDLSRRYTLEQDYDPNNENHRGIMRLIKIEDHGTFAAHHDSELPPWTFDYTYLEYDPNQVGYQNTTVLQRANNGQGGGVEYNYDKEEFLIVPCWGRNNGDDGNPGHGVTFRHYVRQKIISDGLSNQTIIDYQLQGPGWAHGNGWDEDCSYNFEFAGYGVVQRSVTRNGIVEQKVQTHYHQLVRGELEHQDNPSHLAGLSHLQITLDANNVELQRTLTSWNDSQQVHGTDWARRDRITTTIDGVTNVTVYSYEEGRQDGEQYGNLTLIQEYMNASGSGTPYRTHETLFYPRNDAGGPGNFPDHIRYIVNRPAQQLLWAGNVEQTCQGNSLIYYDDNSSHQTPPTQGLVRLTKVANAEVDCFDINPESWSDTSYIYDYWGNQISVTDPNGNTTETAYDTNSEWPSLYAYPESVTAPPNDAGTRFTTEYTWDKYLGQVTVVTDPNQVPTHYRYDEWGRLQKMWKIGHNENHPTQRFEYHNYVNDSAPFMVRQEQRSDDAGSSVSHIEAYTFYDGLGREIQTRSTYINPDNQERHAVTFTRYNGLGQPSEVFAPIEQPVTASYLRDGWDMNRPHTSTFYDALGRVLDMTQPDGSLTASRYGNETVDGQVFFKHSVIDANRHRKRSRIDALGRTHSVVEQEGNCGNFEPGFECGGEYTETWSNYAITIYNYDVADRLTGVTDHDGNPTTITYDLAGRKISMDDPDMGQWHYNYDAAGNLIRQLDAREQAICFYYDNLHRLTNKFYPNGNDDCPSDPLFPPGVVYIYDAFDPDNGQFGRGQRTGMVDDSGSTNWKYDQRGRVTQERREFNNSTLGTFTTQWSYDALDRVRKITYPADNQGQLGEVVTSHYEPLRQANLTTVDSNMYFGTAYANNMKYNVYGQLTSSSHRRSAPIKREYEYYSLNTTNGLGRLQKIMTTAPNQEIRQHLEYNYDAAGNVMSITDTDYDYEKGTQTTQIQEFSYDELDRLLTAEATGGNDGNYSQTHNYDQIGNMYRALQNYDYGWQEPECGPTKPHALASRYQGPHHWSYSYDCNGNMTEATFSRNGVEEFWIDYVYNAENRLIEVLNEGYGSGSTTIASFVYDGDGQRVISVQNEVTTIYIGNHVEWNVETETMTKYYYAGGQRIAMREGDTAYYPLTDHLGSTSTTLNYDGEKHSSLGYKAFGRTRYTDGDTPTQRRFTGQIQDSATGLYFYNARYYNPMIGRFIQPDTIVPEPGNPQSLNRYSYVYNNPLRYTDPTGHRCVDAIEDVDCSLFKPSKFAPTSVPPRFRQLRAYAGIAFLASQTDQWWGSTLSPQEAMGMMLYIEVGILIEQDANGNWYLPDAVMEAATRRYNEYCSGGTWSGSCMSGFWNYFEPIRNAHRYFNPGFLVDLRSEYDGFFLEAADQIINSPEVGGIRPDRPSGWGTILQGNPVYQKALEVDGNIGSRSNQAFFTKGYYGGNNPGVFVVVSENQQAHLCGTNQYGPLSCIQ